MKKFSLILIAIFALINIIAATNAQADSWRGWGSGKTETWTNSTINQGGYFCGNSGSFFQSAGQSGGLSIKAKGRYDSWEPDDVKVKVKAGYNTGYDQYQGTPGGYQSQWGEQWGNGSVRVESPR